MNIKKIITSLVISVIVFSLVTIISTNLLREWIFFSMFLGLPIGIIAGISTFLILYYKIIK